MGKKHQFRNSIIQVLAYNRDGSYATQSDRRKVLLEIAKQIHQHGYQLDHARYMKRKHIEFLVKHWLANGISAGTIKNRMSHVRWLMDHLNKKGIVPSNDALNIPKRQYVTHQDKSRTLTLQDLSKIRDTGMRLSLEGQRLFGLRMEESLKIQPHIADGGAYLHIRGSWAKGGRDRIIPILTTEQREWLNICKGFVKNRKASLIPVDTTYKTYRKRFEKSCERAGINHRHGLRHLYAQNRYRTLTGWPSPVKGGPSKKNLSQAQRSIDRSARLQISSELGHSRISITEIYL